MFLKLLISGIYFAATCSIAAQIEPLKINEIAGGAGCAIVNTKGDIIIDQQVKIDGALVSVKKVFVSKQSSSFDGKEFKAIFSLNKGKLQEYEGGFNVGKSPVGKLKFIYKGVDGVMDAREQCFGSD